MPLEEPGCREISLNSYVEFLDSMEVKATLDLGDAYVTVGHHQQYGAMTLVNQMSGRCALVVH